LCACSLADGPGQPAQVRFDTELVVFTTPDGISRHINWSELQQVAIKTTDQGPALPDFFFVLESAQGAILEIPSETPGADELLVRLQQLPGFDNAAVIKASGSAENAVFLCWRKGAA